MNAPHKPVLADAERQLASLPIAVVLLEPGGKIAEVNPAAEQFFGQGASRLVGRPFRDLFRLTEPHVAKLFTDTDTPTSARAVAANTITRGVCRLDMTSAPLADMPGWQLIALHGHGVFAELGEGDGGENAATLRGPEVIAHEIKNPLAGIRGAAQLLGRKVGKKERKLTELITSEVDRIATLIEQMQMLSGQNPAPVAPCNLHRLIRKAVTVVEMADKADDAPREIRIVEEFDPSLPEVMGDADGLVQVLINLLTNARKACEDVEDARIEVRTRFVSGLQHYLEDSNLPVAVPIELRIADNGPGVPPELRDTMFEPFVTGNRSGHGLGLALVRKLVRDMNGRISHDRHEERGETYFRVYLPMAPVKKKMRFFGSGI